MPSYFSKNGNHRRTYCHKAQLQTLLPYHEVISEFACSFPYAPEKKNRKETLKQRSSHYNSCFSQETSAPGNSMKKRHGRDNNRKDRLRDTATLTAACRCGCRQQDQEQYSGLYSAIRLLWHQYES